MSDYFGALIRASGLAAGTGPPVAADHGITEIEAQHDAPPAATSPVTAGPRRDTQGTEVDHGITEIEVQHDAPPAAITPVTEGPRTDTEPTEIITPPPVAPPTLPAPAIREYSAPPGTAYTELASDRPLATSPLGSPLVSNPRPQEAASDPGQAMVHAALRWVTTDVPNPSASTEIAPDPTPPIPAQELTTHKIAPPAKPSVTPPAAGPVPGAITLPPEAAIPLRVAPIRHPASTDQPPPWASAMRRPAGHDEEVEITIGAIHLRVDSPPPQTVVQAPAPTPRPPANRPPPRSALTRRALRRL
jgi:hypothetical protein